MKQIIVGLGILVVLIAYSIGVRHEQPVVTKPVTSSLAAGSGSSSSSDPAASGSSPSSNSSSSNTSASGYKDGTYTGSVEDAYYGNVQVSATISGGKISDVTFLQYPDTHSDSVMINQQAMPWLKQEAIQKQSAQVDIVSGATFTSQAFIQSLTNALHQA